MSECDNCKNKKDWPCPNTCGYMGTCDGWEPKPMTNADRIRSMSDEELAEFMCVAGGCGPTFDLEYCQGRKQCGGKNECWLDWLKQEAAE